MTVPVGASGVHLKHFERVVVDLLPHTEISYSELPPLPDENWPFDQLPAYARVYGTATGQLSDLSRARRKEQQLQSMLRCILAVTNDDIPCTIADFGGGTGHLAIPLALLRPKATVIVVDLHNKSLELLHSKVEKTAMVDRDPSDLTGKVLHPATKSDDRLRHCAKIPNLYTFSGPLQAFDLDFDVGVALHLCGESTDVALRKCAVAQVRALVFAPCCVGKLNRNVKNPYIWQSTGANDPTVEYPQSSLLKRHIRDMDDWNALAKAADYSEAMECRTTRNAARRTAKALLETDRRLWLQEEFGYETLLTRMEPWEATPKNDILVAWRKDLDICLKLKPNEECQRDIQRTVDYLICRPATSDVKNEHYSVEWTAQEETEIRLELQKFLQRDDLLQHTFPVGMGTRRRKLIHYVAETLALAHWGVGQTSSERTVTVAKRRSGTTSGKP